MRHALHCQCHQAFKEATHINSGLLALGNVIVALSEPAAGGGAAAADAGGSGSGGNALQTGGGGAATVRRPHIPYRWVRRELRWSGAHRNVRHVCHWAPYGISVWC